MADIKNAVEGLEHEQIIVVKPAIFTFVRLLMFIIPGAIFLLIGLLGFDSVRIDSGWNRTFGLVNDVDIVSGSRKTTYTPVVEYKIDGESYIVTGKIYSDNAPIVGSSIEIAYNPQRPSDGKLVQESGGSSLKMWVSTSFGAILLLIGIDMYIKDRRRLREIAELQQNGQKTRGIIDKLVFTGLWSRQPMYKIVARAVGIDGQVNKFTSDQVTGSIANVFKDVRSKKIPIDIYLDLSNPKKYFVDTSIFPTLSADEKAELVNRVGIA